MSKFCFDLDGTLCSKGSNDYSQAEPFQTRIDKVNKLYDEGHHIIIYTARGTSSGIDWTEKTKQQLQDWGVKYHELLFGKPSYDFFVDDKAFNSETYFNYTRDIVNYFSNVAKVIQNIDISQIETVIDLLLKTTKKKSTIYVFGNGGSAATASHLACDFNKGVNLLGRDKIKVVCLNDNIPTLLAYANDVDFEAIFAEQLRNCNLTENDVVFGISGSGNSPNILKAIELAKGKGCKTVGLCGFDGGKLAQIVDYKILVPIDNMTISEDLHLVIGHIVSTIIKQKNCFTKENQACQ